MIPGVSDLLPFSLTFLVPLIMVLALMPIYLNFLKSKNRVTVDAHKRDKGVVPVPAGPLLIIALIVGETIIYFSYSSIIPLAIAGVVMIAGLIGLLDDIYTLGGKIKPTLLILAAILIIFGRELFPSLYDPKLYFPIFSSTGTHLVIYSILILASIPVLANAFNMMDAFNGEISGFTFITSLALVFAALLRAYALSDYSVVRIAAILPLVAVSLAFFVYNRYPSRIFSGDSGSLTFGAMYAALAIIGGVEFAALVAVIPAILNSFFILSSVKRVVEHKRIIIRPTYLGEDGRLYANDQPRAPTTLARMLLLDGPLTEQEIVSRVFTLTIFSSILSVTTSTLTWLT